jgi:hypothetical protein
MLELITGVETHYIAGDVWKTKNKEEIQILWMRKDSEYQVHTTEGKFLRIDDLEELVERQLYLFKSNICSA